MTERKCEIKAFDVDYVCDKCGDEIMEPTGIMLLCNPPLWPHKCIKCGHVENLREKYPTMRYERVTGESQ